MDVLRKRVRKNEEKIPKDEQSSSQMPDGAAFVSNNYKKLKSRRVREENGFCVPERIPGLV